MRCAALLFVSSLVPSFSTKCAWRISDLGVQPDENEREAPTYVKVRASRAGASLPSSPSPPSRKRTCTLFKWQLLVVPLFCFVVLAAACPLLVSSLPFLSRVASCAPPFPRVFFFLWSSSPPHSLCLTLRCTALSCFNEFLFFFLTLVCRVDARIPVFLSLSPTPPVSCGARSLSSPAGPVSACSRRLTTGVQRSGLRVHATCTRSTNEGQGKV